MSSDSESVNPYAPPLASSEVPLVGSAPNAPDTIRREHIKHEASIKSIGLLYGLSAIAFTIATGAFLVTAFAQPQGVEMSQGVQLGIAAILAVITGVLWYTVVGLRGLKPQVRPWAIGVSGLLTVVSLLSINPIGLLINGYILWLVAGQKGKRVLSPDYKDIIAATPDIKYKTSIVVWILLLLVLTVIILGGVAIAFGEAQ